MSTELGAREIAELLAKYDKPGPRYTSYPTAVEFAEDVGAAAYEARLAAASREVAPLSLYFHLPFCRERCTFCGCHVIITRKHGVSADYLGVLHREIDLVADRLGGRSTVRQLHWGGGTPTYQTADEIDTLFAKIASRFRIEPGAEVAIEVDPRVTSDEQLELLRRLGFNRLSMGVQDFTPEVQAAVNRNQTEEETRGLVAKCRALGFESLNIDLIYGLPKQTVAAFVDNLKGVIELRPERVAVYSYAHVPWMKANQRKTEEALLPPPATKLRLFAEARRAFVAAGYDPIGMDHFALPDDELAVAARRGELHRNFMGYTTKPAPDMIGLGLSAIGDVGAAYFQNHKILSKYEAAVAAGELPILRGVELTASDRLRRDVIQSIMCNWKVDKRAIERRHGVRFDEAFAAELIELRSEMENGFVEVDAAEIRVVGTGRIFVRNIAMIFDERLKRMEREGPVFSRTV
ncbi:MAG: oxygen-independent coproporphyrinogen III oxidase [bacterium]